MPSIQVVRYQPDWPVEFERHAAQLRSQLHGDFVRIDHIGSTAVPGLAAKDVIDLQIAVQELTEAFVEKLVGLGYTHHPQLTDNATSGADPSEFQKQVFTEPPSVRRINVHARRFGAANMRQAILFRDYLRAHPATAAAHGLLKQRLARERPNDRGFYYAIKDPVFEIIWEAAEQWAAQTKWHY